MNLHCSVSHTTHHLSTKQFATTRFSHHRQSAIPPTCRLLHHTTRSIRFGSTICEHRLYQLKFGDWLTKLLPLHRVTQTVINQAFGRCHTHRPNMNTPTIKHFHCRLETHPLSSTDQRICADSAIGERDISRVRTSLSHFSIPGTDRDARSITFDQQRGNTLNPISLWRRSRKHRKQTRFRGISDVALGSINDVFVTFPTCRG